MKNLDISVLLDFYGDMLTEKQREVIGFYYNEDLSLSEIGEFEGITPPGRAGFHQTAARRCFGNGRAVGPGETLSENAGRH